jgi:hypothetical protein
LLIQVFHSIESEQQLSKVRVEQGGESLVLGCFNENGSVILSLRDFVHFVEQYGLADTSEAHKEEAF